MSREKWAVLDDSNDTVGPLSDTQEQAERMAAFLNRDNPGLRSTTYRAMPVLVTVLPLPVH